MKKSEPKTGEDREKVGKMSFGATSQTKEEKTKEEKKKEEKETKKSSDPYNGLSFVEWSCLMGLF